MNDRTRPAIAVILLFACVATNSSAQSATPLATNPPAAAVTSDDVTRAIDPRDAYADRLTPGIRWAVQHGLRMRVVEPRPIVAPLAYRKATEEHSSKVKLSADGGSLEGYVAGQPFPNIDAADPMAANKIMWNVELNFRATDDIAAFNIEMNTGRIAANEAMQVERHYVIGEYRRLSYIGRLYVDPKPALPNPEGYQFKEIYCPFLEPPELDGNGFIAYRHIAPDRPDLTSPYMPQRYVVRRLSPPGRSDGLFGTDIDVDSYWGFNAKLSTMKYQLVGEATLLLPMHGISVPSRWQQPENWLFDDAWEPRRVWVVEAVSNFPQYAYGKRVLYIDQESYLVAASDLYDRTGKLWKVWLGLYRFANEGRPGATRVRYEEEMPFLQAVTMIDTQLNRATTVAIPGSSSNDEGWLINLGAASVTNEDLFTPSHLIGGCDRPRRSSSAVTSRRASPAPTPDGRRGDPRSHR